MLELAAAGKTPDVLVSVTNDGWFFGSSELICTCAGRLPRDRNSAAAAHRANTGFSANIDPLGRIVDQGARRKPDILLVNALELTSPEARELTPYVRYGEVCGKAGWYLICLVALAELVFAIQQRQRRNNNRAIQF